MSQGQEYPPQCTPLIRAQLLESLPLPAWTLGPEISCGPLCSTVLFLAEVLQLHPGTWGTPGISRS